MTDTLEQTARRIAGKGREALLACLRPAFRDAAAAHSAILQLDDERLEQMVLRAADRADGLQWRRALAGVATEELGIGLGEALSHPAVVRAQAILGAPSYEESLAALASVEEHPAAPTGQTEPAAKADQPDDQAPAEAQAPGTDDEQPAGDEEAPLPEDSQPAPEDKQPPPEDDEPSAADEGPGTAEAPALQPVPDDTRQVIRLAAVHLGGIANLEPAEPGVELRLSDDGLDIARGPDELLGRLRWPEIRSLDVPPSRGLRRRRRGGGAHLVIRTRHGDASFEIPDTSAEELQAQLDPLRRRHAAG